MNIRRALVVLFGAIALASCAPVETPASEGPIMITLQRTVCFGFCPAYTVRITGEGEVTYIGERFVNAVGERHATIPRADVERLLHRFEMPSISKSLRRATPKSSGPSARRWPRSV
jgi:hypothetical protein